jgi:thioredoxin-like negative regulator of GroEL
MKKNVVLLSAVCLLSFSGCQFLKDWFGKKEEVKQEATAVATPAPSAEIKKITSKEQFEADVQKAQMPVVVKFETETCSICKETAPIFQKAADQFTGKVRFAVINAEEQKELANIHEVKGVPAFLFFNKEGKLVDRIDGAIQEADFIEKVNNLQEK